MEMDTRTAPSAPRWAAFRRYYSPDDGLVHRVIDVRTLSMLLHDEAVVVVVPFTKCGFSLEKAADAKVPALVGFRTDEVMLTCVECSSGCQLEGDRIRMQQKNDLFGFVYGRSINQLSRLIKRPRFMKLRRALFKGLCA